ncbi:Glycine/serine hydroxymethyltransferase, partial [Trachipleistophora hominis]
VGAILLGDISHPSGLISHGLMNNPFKYCDVVTTVMQKTMGGPRAGIIYCKKKYEQLIRDAQTVLCGNSHTHIILQVAVALKEALSEGHYELSLRIQSNARYLRKRLIDHQFDTYTTDSHMILLDMGCAIKACNFEIVADFLGISLDRVSLAIHPCACKPTGIRLGTTGVTRRGMGKRELKKIGKILKCIKNYVEHDFDTKMLNNGETPSVASRLALDQRCLRTEDLKKCPELRKVKQKVRKMTRKFPVPFVLPKNRNGRHA